MAAQNCRRRKLGLICRLKDELDAARRTRQQLNEDRRQLTQECAEWALRVANAKNMVLIGLGKNPLKYSLDIIDSSSSSSSTLLMKEEDECVGTSSQNASMPAQSNVIIKKRKRSSCIELKPYQQLSEDAQLTFVIENDLRYNREEIHEDIERDSNRKIIDHENKNDIYETKNISIKEEADIKEEFIKIEPSS